MTVPSNGLACRALFLQAADEGRGEVLFGPGWKQLSEAAVPFVEGVPFPDMYLEFPLAGEPFLDVTFLYGQMGAGERLAPGTAPGTERLFDWYAEAQCRYDDISFGFELDAGTAANGPAAVHLQTREHIELAAEFCEILGDPAAGRLYTEQAARMPKGWELAYFGIFRGRPGFPLRVCGYLSDEEKKRCAADPGCLREAFGKIGFTAWDERMLEQVSAFLAATPNTADFQMDLLPDGRFGETFSIDAGFAVRQEEKMKLSFNEGDYAAAMELLESWGAADGRRRLAADMSLTRSLPVEDEHGETKLYGLVLATCWIKARWRGKILQKAKGYSLGWAGIV